MALTQQQVLRVYSAVARLQKAYRDARTGRWVVPPTIPVAKVSTRLYPGEPPPPQPPGPEADQEEETP